jgi:hypothetical protein
MLDKVHEMFSRVAQTLKDFSNMTFRETVTHLAKLPPSDCYVSTRKEIPRCTYLSSQFKVFSNSGIIYVLVLDK